MDILFDDNGTFTLLTVDAVTEIRHSLRAQMTEFPVERDADRSDHHRAVVGDFSLDVVITDTPISGSADELQFRTLEAWQRLEDARDRHLPAVIVTDLKTYGEDTDLLLKEATVVKTAKDGSWIKAALTFGEMVTFNTQLVDDPVAARARDRRRVDVGSQSTTEVTPDRLTSLLANGNTGPVLVEALAALGF
jgi:hypothetical protein